jgi:hypothetical protein
VASRINRDLIENAKLVYFGQMNAIQASRTAEECESESVGLKDVQLESIRYQGPIEVKIQNRRMLFKYTTNAARRFAVSVGQSVLKLEWKMVIQVEQKRKNIKIQYNSNEQIMVAHGTRSGINGFGDGCQCDRTLNVWWLTYDCGRSFE